MGNVNNKYAYLTSNDETRELLYVENENLFYSPTPFIIKNDITVLRIYETGWQYLCFDNITMRHNINKFTIDNEYRTEYGLNGTAKIHLKKVNDVLYFSTITL